MTTRADLIETAERAAAADLRCKARRGKDRCELPTDHGNVHRITWIGQETRADA